MNIFRKTAIFIACGLIIIGLAMTVAGIVFGGKLSVTDPKDDIDFSKEYTNITSISINYSAGNIVVKDGETFSIDAKNVNNKTFSSTVENGVWTITDKYRHTFDFWNRFHFGPENSTVTITIPKDILVEKFQFEIGAGKVEIESLRTKDFIAKVGAGEAVIHNLAAANTNLDCGVGNIEVDGEITGDSIVNCGVGNIDLILKGDPAAYDYDIEVGLGTTTVNGDHYTGGVDKTVKNDNSTGSFKLDCGVGEINLTVTKE